MLMTAIAAGAATEPVDYANPLVGTALKGEGGTAPFVGEPFAMTNFLAQTRENKMGTMAYVYDDTHIMGFMASHQPTVWMGDYGYVSLMPQTGGEIRTLPEERKITFSHKNEKATPAYYSVTLDNKDGKIKAEIAAAKRAGMFRFTYPRTDSARVIIQGINLNPGLADWANDYGPRIASIKGWIKVDTVNNEIVGYNPDRQAAQIGPELADFKGYFVIKPDKKIKRFGTWEGSDIYPGKDEIEGTRSGAYIDFATKKGEAVTFTVGTSFIDIDQARDNMKRELPADGDMKKLVASTRAAWNDKLGKMKINGVDDETKRIFYTALFHCYLFPREFSEYGRYYSAFDDKVHEGVSFNDYSLWDTFRAYHPLMTIIEDRKSVV